MDLAYRLTPLDNLTLSRWAFSGFCLRTRKDGDIRLYSPSGPAKFPAPNHLKPGARRLRRFTVAGAKVQERFQTGSSSRVESA